MESFCTVYVLRSARDGNLYIGMTNDLKRRLKEHQQGKSTSTRHRRPFELIYAESFTSRVDAAKRERYLKSGPGHRFLRNCLPQGTSG
ncbi:MAG: GIY-YIG nuclease family protein [Ignavibacteria bacterium]|nr:GIY-YIG nuclease family protein [Ignavibacteria bacterium]